MSRKLVPALTGIAATLTALVVYTMTTSAGEVHLDFPAFARVNVEDDPHGYAPAIAMPTKIELRVVIDNEDIEITADPPWVDVMGSIDEDGEIDATGSGTVLGIANIDVEFEGLFAEGIIVGSYRMGTDLDLPPQDDEDPAPIEYELKPNIPDTPTPTPTDTPPPTNTSPASATPTATSPAPVDTPTATATSPPAATPTFTPTPTTTSPRAPQRDGDLNKDGTTNSLDALLVLQYVAELIDALPNAERADVNGDGVVDVFDALLMLQLSAGLLDSLPVA